MARGLFLPFLPITLPTLLMDGLAGVERGRSRKISRAGFLDFLSIISSQKISLGTAWAGLIILSDSMMLSDNLSFTTPKQPSNDKPTKTIQLYPKSLVFSFIPKKEIQPSCNFVYTSLYEILKCGYI